MTKREGHDLIDALRNQVEKKGKFSAWECNQRLHTALAILDEIETGGIVSSGGNTHVPQLKKSLREFYHPLKSEWAQNFALNDLDIFRSVCCPNDN